MTIECVKRKHRLGSSHMDGPCPFCVHEETLELYMRLSMTGNLSGTYQQLAQWARDGIVAFYSELYGQDVSGEMYNLWRAEDDS